MNLKFSRCFLKKSQNQEKVSATAGRGKSHVCSLKLQLLMLLERNKVWITSQPVWIWLDCPLCTKTLC